MRAIIRTLTITLIALRLTMNAVCILAAVAIIYILANLTYFGAFV